jgi:hypothetical protein
MMRRFESTRALASKTVPAPPTNLHLGLNGIFNRQMRDVGAVNSVWSSGS